METEEAEVALGDRGAIGTDRVVLHQVGVSSSCRHSVHKGACDSTLQKSTSLVWFSLMAPPVHF